MAISGDRRKTTGSGIAMQAAKDKVYTKVGY